MKKFFSFFFVLVFAFLFSGANVLAGTPQFSFHPNTGTSKSYENLKAGDVISGEILLKLYSGDAEEFVISFENSSGSGLAESGSGSFLDMSTWINFPNGEKIYFEDLESDDGREVLVPFVITVPEDIVPGDYRGSMKASLVKDFEGDSQGVAGVSMNSAVGVMFEFSVPGERVHGMELIDFIYDGFVSVDDPRATSDIGLKLGIVYKSWGNTLLRPFVDVLVKDMWGNIIYEGRFDKLPDTFSGDALKNTSFILEGVEPFYGWITIESKVFYSPVSLKGVVSGEFFDVGEAYLKVYNIPWWFFVIPFVFFVFILFYFFVRLYRVNYLISISKIYIVKEGDDLHDLCNKFKVDPKKIIFVNKLKDPYFINPGDELFIPIT